jgi:hypothetical protein
VGLVGVDGSSQVSRVRPYTRAQRPPFGSRPRADGDEFVLSGDSSASQRAGTPSTVVFSALADTSVLGGAPRMENAVERGPDWAGMPVIATVARLLCRELTLQNEYLRDVPDAFL